MAIYITFVAAPAANISRCSLKIIDGHIFVLKRATEFQMIFCCSPDPYAISARTCCVHLG
jgi:hypothetical protein